VIIYGKDLAKSGYKPNMKYKSFINFLYFWLHIKNRVHKSGYFQSFFSLASGDWKTPKSLEFRFLGKSLPIKNKAACNCTQVPLVLPKPTLVGKNCQSWLGLVFKTKLELELEVYPWF